MPYTKPLKARSGASMQYDSGDYPGSQAMVLQAAGWETFPSRQAQAVRRRGQLVPQNDWWAKTTIQEAHLN